MGGPSAGFEGDVRFVPLVARWAISAFQALPGWSERVPGACALLLHPGWGTIAA